MHKGLFIALEGGEGSGKDTQIERLRKLFDPETTVFTSEPGGTEIGEKLRSFVLHTGMEPEIELLVFLTARAVLMEQVVRPALAQGKLVIANRFGLSTIAYQIYGRERHALLPLVRQLSEKIVGTNEPRYILLDVPPDVGLARVESRKDGKTRFDAENIRFHERVRSGYQNHYNEDGRSAFVDATLPIEEVTTLIYDRIHGWLS